MFGDNNKDLSVSDKEKVVLDYWKENKIFEKSVNKVKKPFFERLRNIFKKEEFVFYDGPPFATGLPHYGHILASAIKDVIPRFKTMRGYFVRRVWGWDCHGLPLEVEAEKELGIKVKKDIEKFGIEKFNNQIRKNIFKYVDSWKEIIPRMGRFVDMDNAYKTIDTTYTESVWYLFKKLYDKKIILNGFKNVHFCPRCSTVVSNNEVADSYVDLMDKSIYVLFELKEEKDTYLVAWTTTPWTLFGNVALAVDKNINYKVVEQNGKKYIVQESALEIFDEGVVVSERKGSDLVNLEYLPPIENIYLKKLSKVFLDKAHRVYEADFIDEAVGTGIVHIAPAYGADDLKLMQKQNIPIIHHLTKDGIFVKDLGMFAGLRPKSKGNPKDVENLIIDELKKNKTLHSEKEIEHSYPVCWRCETPLVNYSTSSWFVSVTKFRKNLISENKKIKWTPSHLRDGRFGKWISNSKDWSISRTRFWGAPLPVWQNEKTNEYVVVSSIEEMMTRMKARNKYYFVRHGQSKSNAEGKINVEKNKEDGLSELGKEQGKELLKNIKSKKIDVIISSPFQRTSETAKYISKASDVPILYDEDLSEIHMPGIQGDFHDKVNEYLDVDGDIKIFTNTKIAGGESYLDVYKRLLNFLEKTDTKYEGKNIAVVTHRALIWVALNMKPKTCDFYDSLNESVFKNKKDSINNAQIFEIEYKHMKRDEELNVDLHRPYIDKVELYDNGEKAKFIGEVFDCWFESGSMPFASVHYPFREKNAVDPVKDKWFPADFIAEGLDQTRGWFFSLLAISVGAFRKTPYKNVITNGIIQAKDGKKMSKRLKNYTDPIEIIEKYGADSLRHYLLSSVAVRGQNINFLDEGVKEIKNKMYSRLEGCLNFYLTYIHLEHKKKSENPLDVYILSRLSEVRNEITASLDKYKIDKATATLLPFVDDLSTWYLRRSRDRIRQDDEDGAYARETLKTVLLEFSKLLAPFAPFFAETLYLTIKTKTELPFGGLYEESVHLCSWPRRFPKSKSTIKKMNIVRKIVSNGHRLRSENQLKVRQPLEKITINKKLDEKSEDLIKAELNVKKVVFNKNLKEDAVLDTHLTKELLDEGFVRDCLRNISEARKLEGFSITENLHTTYIFIQKDKREVLEKNKEFLLKEIRTKYIEFLDKDNDNSHKFVSGDVSMSVSFAEKEKIFS